MRAHFLDSNVLETPRADFLFVSLALFVVLNFFFSSVAA